MTEALLVAAGPLLFAFMNGANDSGTIAAPVVSSRTLSPRASAVLAAAAAFAGAMLLGSAVARTLGMDLVALELLPAAARPLDACIAAAAAAILWGSVAWRFGLPGSYTHALLGGWLGGFLALGGPAVVKWDGAAKVLLGVLVTPPLALAASWAAMRRLYRAAEELSMQALPLVRLVERAGFLGVSLAHGANAAQKSMALLVLAGMSSSGAWPWPEDFALPFKARLACSTAFALGVLLGFTRTLKTVGFRIFRVGPLHSACALWVSGALILASTAAGLPLSAGQINSSSLMGAGAAHNPRAVRWGVAGDLLTNWVLTFPGAAVMAYVLIKVIEWAR